MDNTNLLSGIDIFARGELAYTYSLSYNKACATNASYLESFQKCDAEGSCLPPVTLGWEQGCTKDSEGVLQEMVGAPTPIRAPVAAQDIARELFGDFDYNGLEDVLYIFFLAFTSPSPIVFFF